MKYKSWIDTYFWISFRVYKSNGGFDSQQYYLPITGDSSYEFTCKYIIL